jgi:hypothetical protein
MEGTSITRWSKKAGAGRVREGSTRGVERIVGRSVSSAAVGVAEEEVKILVAELPEESPAP